VSIQTARTLGLVNGGGDVSCPANATPHVHASADATNDAHAPNPIRPTRKRRRVLRSPYFARGFGRIWNFTTFGRVPLPPSWCQGVYIE